MTGIRWLAVLPFLGILVGTAFVNSVEPLTFGMPLVLAWIVAWVVIGAVIMAAIYWLDPANAQPSDGDKGGGR
jgi:xanthosine utilization system XapX-like protein